MEREREREKSCKITNMIKRSERRPFYFIFRMNTDLCDSYQADEFVVEIEERKQKVPDDYVKSFGRFLIGVLETSTVS